MFLYLAYQAVHVGNKPMASHPEYAFEQAPQRFLDRYWWVADEGRRNLSAMVAALDEGVGNLSTALRNNGMWEDSLVVFSTDNGGPISGSGHASNYPLRGGKAMSWQGGVKGIGFVAGGERLFGHLWRRGGLPPPAWPPAQGQGGSAAPELSAGAVSRSLIHITDWLPTLCSLAGCEGGGRPVGTKPLDGFPAWEAIAHNGSTARLEVLLTLEEVEAAPAILAGEWKLVNTPPELYHLASDPGETNNLAASRPNKVAELLARIAFYNSSAVPPCDRLTPDPASNPKLHGGVWTPWKAKVEGNGCPTRGHST
jgi:arylsulfatase B